MMAMYTFQMRTLDREPLSLALGEFANDGETFAEAGRMLDEHITCDHVEVWAGDRAVVARYREQPIIRPVAA
jgi:hypothetical protein